MSGVGYRLTTESRPVLILFAHPALEKSRANRSLIRGVRSLTDVTFHDLYEAYPDFAIDIRREQELLTAHQVIVFQHPFYWFSTPAILKEWKDLVLQHGWAYGGGGSALKGKQLVNVITTGGREEAYQKDGYHRFTIQEFLVPVEQTAYLCGMEYLPPFVVHGCHQLTDAELDRQAQDYRRVLCALRDGTVDLEKARRYQRLNSDLEVIIRNSSRI